LVGGAALLLRGTVSRPTKDGDIVGERLPDGSIGRLGHLPPELARAALDVARVYGLADDWLNLGPAFLLDGPLPEGFEGRLSPVEFGALRLWVAGREDLVALKLWATANRWPAPGRHLADLQALEPSTDELRSAAAWTRLRDPSPGYRELLAAVLERFGVGEDDDDAGR
ncbi:MAG: DUF6036 family nucleotidyltransferase, partial [Chloroflexota bacterium]